MSGSFSSMEELKRFLKKWPRAYSSLQGTYYGALFTAEKWFLGTKIHEMNWSRKRECSIQELFRMVAHPHRAYLVDQIAKWAPFKNVLEIGCNAGPNLLLLAKRFPDVRFTGIDINRHFIRAGEQWMVREGVKNVSLRAGTADDLARFDSKSMDLTFTDATLMYIGPDKIIHTLKEIMRVTRKVILFNEWCLNGANGKQHSVWYYLHWVHDFTSLFEQIAPDKKVCITRVPSHLWGQDGWQEYGALAEIDLS